VRVYGPWPEALPGRAEREAFLGAGHVTGGELISTRLLSPTEVQGLLVTPSLQARTA
jgi:tRNA pseudouridine55 synthase